MTSTVPALASAIALAAALIAWSANAHAGAYEDCVTAGAPAVVMQCLASAEKQANAELSAVESSLAEKALAVERATGRSGIHAALARAVKDFATYRASHCAYVRALAVREPVAEQAAAACRVDLTRRRVRDLRS
jgi:uncharacterized protein YecT (DUF1311 family)